MNTLLRLPPPTKQFVFLARSALGSLGLCERPAVELHTLRNMLSGPWRDPNPFLDRMRETEPVCWLPLIDAWLVTRHSDVRALFVDARLTSDPKMFRHYRPPRDPVAAKWVTEVPFRSTPADPKSAGRRLVSSAMTPRAVETAKSCIVDVVNEVTDRLRNRRGIVDLIADFTSPIAGTVIGRVAGVPPKSDDELHFRRLARNATRSIRPYLSARKREETERACGEMCEYVCGLVRERIEHPRNDLISSLVQAADLNDPGAVPDIARIVSGLVSAGTGTSGTACARVLRTLFHHDRVLTRLRDDDTLLPQAIDELLRYDSGLLVMPRYVKEDFEFQGRRFEQSQLIALCLQSANRDPRAFAHPVELDIDRDASASLSFGYGAHYCIGANLARTTLVEMLRAILAILPRSARLQEDGIRWSARGMMSQIQSLPVDFG